MRAHNGHRDYGNNSASRYLYDDDVNDGVAHMRTGSRGASRRTALHAQLQRYDAKARGVSVALPTHTAAAPLLLSPSSPHTLATTTTRARAPSAAVHDGSSSTRHAYRHVDVATRTTRSRRGRSSAAARDGSGDDGNTDVQALLRELVDVSQSIAACLSASPQSTPRTQLHDGAAAATRHTTPPLLLPTSTHTASSTTAAGTATLNAHVVERIVRRVERHFAQRIAALEHDKQVLTAQLRALQAQQSSAATTTTATTAIATTTSAATGNNGDDAAHIEQQQQQQQRSPRHSMTSARGGGGSSSARRSTDGDAHESSSTQLAALRRALAAEKEQRLRVEEQTARMSEQHSRVVATLERRLQRQDEQLRRLVASAVASEAAERQHTTPDSVAATAAMADGTTAADGGSIDGHGSHGSAHSSPMTTPRHFLRQHQRHVQQQQQQQRVTSHEVNMHARGVHVASSRAQRDSDDDDHHDDDKRRSSRLRVVTAAMHTTPPMVPTLDVVHVVRTHGDDGASKRRGSGTIATTGTATRTAATAPPPPQPLQQQSPRHDDDAPTSPMPHTRRVTQNGVAKVDANDRSGDAHDDSEHHVTVQRDDDSHHHNDGDDDVDTIGVFLDEIADELRNMERSVAFAS